MPVPDSSDAIPSAAEAPEVVLPVDGADGDANGEPGTEIAATESVEHPAKVMRIASMIKQLLDEVRHAPLDEASRTRLREIYEVSVRELGEGLSPDLRSELARMTLPFTESSVPTESELRIAQAQLVGWLEGLFHGIQATMFAQQMMSRAEIEDMRRRSLPAAAEDRPRPTGPPGYL
ncbi:MAG TPA: bacterial proteasome activator family protein [Acidimicrobiales bacterium]|nr:bacterial proteasome activator family protein [Acidimicrobiales bacterium]